jgi:hypothetical protein
LRNGKLETHPTHGKLATCPTLARPLRADRAGGVVGPLGHHWPGGAWIACRRAGGTDRGTRLSLPPAENRAQAFTAGGAHRQAQHGRQNQYLLHNSDLPFQTSFPWMGFWLDFCKTAIRAPNGPRWPFCRSPTRTLRTLHHDCRCANATVAFFHHGILAFFQQGALMRTTLREAVAVAKSLPTKPWVQP